MLLILGGNPVFTTPADLGLAEALAKVPLLVHLSQHEDETSERCHWQIPEAHFLETWSDVRGYDGTVSIVQPLIAPLYGGRTMHDVIGALSETPEKSPYDLVREHWLNQVAPGAKEPTPAFESAWRRWLHDGVVPDTAFKPKTPTLNPAAIAEQSTSARAAEPRGFDLAFKLDPSILDGRFANNGWLQELPKPITKLTWDNAVIVSPATAEKLQSGGRPAFRGGEHGQIVSDLRRAPLQWPLDCGACVSCGRAPGRLRNGSPWIRPAPRRSRRRRRGLRRQCHSHLRRALVRATVSRSSGRATSIRWRARSITT